MLLSGCKGNTFFWKSTFFYGLIYNQIKKKTKISLFHHSTDSNTTWFSQEFMHKTAGTSEGDSSAGAGRWLNKQKNMIE